MKRTIGTYEGLKGPLIICFGGIHGNEHAGVKALEIVLEMLENEPSKNPNFQFKGRFVALRGNLAALKTGQRFITKDLNRNFDFARLEALDNPTVQEDIEALELIATVKNEIHSYHPENVLLIDLHTTSSPGGIFTIIPEHDQSLDIARSMHAPIIRGMTNGVQGTVMHYFTSANLGVSCKTITFEAGQHEDPDAIPLSIAAIIAALRSVGCVEPNDVENRHDDLLRAFSLNLPDVTRLIAKHTIYPGDQFKMIPGFRNFQKIYKGQQLAVDKHGDVFASHDGLLLMPLYQKKGNDGFFIIQKISDHEIH